MQQRQPFQGSRRKLVLAFDIGTTFSGVSYSLLDPGLVPKIQGVTRYPAQESVGGSSKIPSVLYYDLNGTVRAVGAEALQESTLERAEVESWIKVEWFKLHLRPRGLAQAHITDRDIPPLPEIVTPIKAIADFLRYLFQCTRNYIETTHASGIELWNSVKDRTEIVLSHPNGWEGPQQSQMRQAAVLAGLIPDSPDGQNRLQLVTEGEASLHFCVRNGFATDAMKNGQGIMIVDAGGGTIDLSAYFMTFSPPSFEEIAPAECRLQGSIFVSRRARAFLEKKLRGSNYGSQEDVDQMTQCFDKTTKLTFRNAYEPSYIRFGSARDRDPTVDIRSGQMKLQGTEVAELFRPSVESIIEAVKTQRRAAQRSISSVYLVGGFAASDWLFNKLKESLESLGLKFCRPDSNVNKAVADGAVSFYLDHIVSSRVAKFTYGTEILPTYNQNLAEHRRREHTKRIQPSGDIVIPLYFDPILYKGTKVDEEREFRKLYYQETLDPNHVSVALQCYRGDNRNPGWMDIEPSKFSSLCTISANIPDLTKVRKLGADGTYYWRPDYYVILLFGLTELKAQICWKEGGVEKRGPASVVYDQDSFY